MKQHPFDNSPTPERERRQARHRVSSLLRMPEAPARLRSRVTSMSLRFWRRMTIRPVWRRRRGEPWQSLRLRFALAVAWGLLPTLVAVQWTIVRYREDALDQKREILGSIANLASVGFHGLVVQVETLLVSLAQTPAALGDDPVACRKFLTVVRDKTPELASIGVIGADGRVRCDTINSPDGAGPIGNRDYYARAIRRGTFSIGEYAVSRVTGAPAIDFVYPLVGQDGTVLGVIHAELNLSAMNALSAELRLPPDVRMAVVDRRATVLTTTSPQRFAPGALADARLLAYQAMAGSASVVEDGANPWYAAIAEVPGVPRGDLSVVIESSRAEQVAAAYHQMRSTLAMLLLALPLFFAFAWNRSRRHVFEPLEDLAKTAKAIAAGNLDARASIRATSVEMHDLSAAVNRMAQAQAERILELQRAEATMGTVLSRLREAQRLARLGAWELDLRGGRLTLSAEMRELLGAERNDLQNPYRVIARFLPRSERRPLLHAARRAIAEGGILDVEHTLSAPGGAFRTILHRAEPRFDGAGSVVALVGYAQDVTEQRELALEREAHAVQLRRLADACLFVSTQRTMHDTLNDMTRRAREIIGAGRCRIVLAATRDSATVGQAAGQTEYRAALEERGFTEAERIHEMMRAVDGGAVKLRAGGRLTPAFELRDTGGLRGWLAAPLMAPGGDYLGFIELLDKSRGDFTENDCAVLSQLAQLATIAIVNAQLLRELQDAESRYRELFEYSVEGLFQAGADGRLVLVNMALADMLGYSTPEHMLAERATLLLDVVQSGAGGKKLFDDLYEKGTVRGFDVIVPRTDGGELWASAGVRMVRGEDGSILGYEGSVKDVTARHNAEEALRALNAELERRIEQRTQQLAGREALYRTLTEASPQIIWRADPDGRATFLNQAWTEMSGCSTAESLGLNWIALVHPEDLSRMRALWSEARHARNQMRCEVRFRTRSGRYATFYCVAGPVRDGDGRVREWVGINTDISGHKQAEEALEISNRELEAFSYSVSHDLRAPLHTIEGFSQALLNHYGGSLDSKARHYVERINNGARTMASLIEHLLSLARVTRIRLERSTVNLSALARTAVAALREEEPGRDVEVVIAEGLVTSGSPHLLELAVSNLLQNAWKYTRTTPGARIEFDMEATPSGRIFQVRDNGVGFDMRYADKLFVPFQRLHSQSEFQGTGVGLAIVKRVIQRHHGDIWVRAAQGAGATFFFSLWVRDL